MYHSCHSQQKRNLIQRTVSGTEILFEPLERKIREELIPALVGRQVSDTERRILALPYRYGGMGILSPIDTADREYHASKEITSDLADLIYQQEQNLQLLDKTKIDEKKRRIYQMKEE